MAFRAVFLWKPRIFFPRLLKLFSRRYYILMIRQTLEQTVGSRGRVGSDPREASTHQGRRSCSWERGHDCPGRGSLDPLSPGKSRELPRESHLPGVLTMTSPSEYVGADGPFQRLRDKMEYFF